MLSLSRELVFQEGCEKLFRLKHFWGQTLGFTRIRVQN